MKLTQIKTLLLVVLMTGASWFAVAQDLKIGYVDVERLLSEATLAQAAETRLKAEFKQRDADINQEAARLREAADILAKEQADLTQVARERRNQELVDRDRELQRKRREFNEDLEQRKKEEQAKLIERANRVLKQIFDNEKYDLIIQDSVLVGPRVDITDKVIAALNKAN